MKRLDIKTAFGGEVPFTKFIADDAATARRLLSAIDLYSEDGFKVTPEERTVDNKRVDLVVRGSEGGLVAIIESQDASGWLDSIHASKVTYYMYDRGCNEGVLICEDADEHIKGYVRYINENSPFRITLVSVLIFEQSGRPHCEFVPLIRPTTIEKGSTRASSVTSTTINEMVEQLNANNPGLFTNKSSEYVSKNNVAGTGVNVLIRPRIRGFKVGMFHRGKFNNDAFKNSFTEFCRQHGLEAKFHTESGSVDGEATATEADAIRVFNLFITAVESNQIVLQ
jgi:hypothetical protein